VVYGLKVALCLDGAAAIVDMFGAKHKYEKSISIASDTCFLSFRKS
jgi:hypothetical protein